MTELLLVLASRRENITKIIEPGLSEGKVVVIDRFIDSTLVYQGVLGCLGVEKMKEIMKLTATWLEPDLTFIMDIDSGHSLARIVPGDKFENQGPEYHRAIRKSFLDLAVGKRHVIVNSDRPRDEVARDIRDKADAVITV